MISRFSAAMSCGMTAFACGQNISHSSCPISLDRVVEFREQYSNLIAAATVRVDGFEHLDASEKSCTDEVLGRVEWRHDGISRFYSVRYDLPVEHRAISAGGYFLDQDSYVLPDRRVVHLILSHQVLVTDDSSIGYFPCLDSVLFGCLPSDTSDSLAPVADVSEQWNGGGVLLTIASLVDESEPLTVTLDPSLDYAPVAWERGVLSCSVNWRRAEDGLVVPQTATLTSSLGRAWYFEFEKFDVGACEPINFVDVPGTLVGDYVAKPGEQTVYRVGDSGAREPVVMIDTTPRPVPPATTAAVAVGSILTVVLSAGASLLWHTRRARRRMTE